MAALNVTAIIVTRGDHDLGQILDSLPDEWERIIWDNHAGITIYENEGDWRGNGPPQPDNWADLSVYGRYAAIEYASHDLIYVQDDDCVVSEPRHIVEHWWEGRRTRSEESFVVCNMPSEFRHGFYEEHALVGFGACFHRDAPGRAFSRFFVEEPPDQIIEGRGTYAVVSQAARARFGQDMLPWFLRTCDIVFTALTPRVLVDVPHENLPWAFGPGRMWTTEGHMAERQRMLELVRKVRVAA